MNIRDDFIFRDRILLSSQTVHIRKSEFREFPRSLENLNPRKDAKRVAIVIEFEIELDQRSINESAYAVLIAAELSMPREGRESRRGKGKQTRVSATQAAEKKVVPRGARQKAGGFAGNIRRALKSGGGSKAERARIGLASDELGP